MFALPRFRTALVIGCFALSLLLLWFLAPKEFTADLLDAFPSNSKFIRSARMISSFEPTHRILLEIYKSGEPMPHRLIAFQDELIRRLGKLPEIRRLDYSTQDERYRDLARFYLDRRFLLCDMNPAPDDGQMVLLLKTWRARMAGPESFPASFEFRRDPLELFPSPQVFLSKLRIGGFRYVAYQGRLFSEDLSRLLMFVSPQDVSLDLGRSFRLYDGMARAIEDAQSDPLFEGVSARFVGQLNYLVENARQTAREVSWVVGLSVLGLCLIYLLFLKSVRLMLVAGLSIAGAVAFSIALSSVLFRQIHLMSVAFGSVIAGISVDYAIHYYVHAMDPAGRETLQVQRRAIFLGMATTSIGFLVLMVSRFPLVTQMSFLALTGIVCAYALILFTAKAAFPVHSPADSAPKRPIPSNRFFGPMALIGYAVVIPLALTALLLSTFDDNIQNLDMPHPQLNRAEKEIRHAFGLDVQPRMVLFSGNSLETLLLLSERFGRAMEPGDIYLLPSDLQPSETTQKRRWDHLAQVDWSSVEELMIRAGTPLGFRTDAFRPFFDEVARNARIFDPIHPESNDFITYINIIHFAQDGVHAMGFINPEAAGRVQDRVEPSDSDSVFPFDPKASFSKEILDLKARFSLLLGLDVLLVFLYLAWALRSPVRSALAMLPSLAGLTAVLCVFVLLDKPLNLLHVMSMVIVVSAGVDYGIFSMMSARTARTTAKGILAAGATTLFSFGLFAFLSNPALQSIGLTVILGIGVSMAISLFFLGCIRKQDRDTP
ncbi:MAG: hypothetical protein HY788_14660 [Deltaproteobacteria bacterium]|nr:hypothetical protein [Deltaproteobacteria bacterium]